MDEKEVKEQVERIIQYQLDSGDEGDRENFGEARILQERADKIERELEAAGYMLIDDEKDVELVHVHKSNLLKKPGDRLYTFSIGDWEWINEQ